MKDNTTIIISCAGMGSRLGAGCTKALIDICGKPLIIRQLEMLADHDDIRVVVGYQAERVIETVRAIREDVRFLYNLDYKTTGTAASFSKGLDGAREYAVALDGDLLVNPDDMKSFLEYDGECIGGCDPTTDNPVLMELNEKHQVIEFSREHGQLEWTGLAKIKSRRLTAGTKHVYMMLEPLMPIDVLRIRTKEIDTEHDYENALKWFECGCR
ncbi:MAG: NTP transferase domain-containing protein [Huintestinicola sp.]|uniref:NTP transferase domain-containing protein n=1 Tax=Huintestinicola sp. TaxID=2981661 RepID=UPI003F07B911